MNPANLSKLGVALALLLSGADVSAQSDAAQLARNGQLKELARSLKARDTEQRGLAELAAKNAGFPMRRELPNGRVLELQRIAPGIGPVFYITNNVDAAITVSTDKVWLGGGEGLELDGAGMTVGEWDGGAVLATHSDLLGRVTQVDGATTVSGHSTHVAGTLIGAGDHLLYPQARGMAYEAHLDAHDWNSDTAEMALAASNGLLISNHSYGIAAGWLYLGGEPPDQWWWIGGEDPLDVEDANFGYYDSEAQLWDQIAFDAPHYLIVKASGNDRWDVGPFPDEEYTVIDQEGVALFTSTLPRNSDCAPFGYDCLPGHSVAKNILTVGAVDDLTNGYAPLSGPAQVAMTGFSGWGPTDDGRIKPDLVGNGMWVVSTWPDAPGYAAALGTSMAAPNVTGSLLLLQEHYQEENGGNMRAATLKALAIHTADEAGSSDGPDYAFGWGLLNTAKAARVITEDGGSHQIIEGTLANGGLDSVEISVSVTDVIIKATLVWTDPPGTPAAPSLDPTDLMLVNDLELRMTRGPSIWLPWILDPTNPSDAADRGVNFRDNVEQVTAQVALTGSYFIEVSHDDPLLDTNPQDYSLVISILPPPLEGSFAAIDEDFSGGMPAGWSVQTEQGVPWTIQTPVPGDQSLDNRTGGSGLFAVVNNQFTRTTTSLVSPTLDLSSATNAVLSFNSNMLFSDDERINVDVSTDGGASWRNVWWKHGLIGLPSFYTLDLTGDLAGESNAVISFRYYTFNGPKGYHWQIDNVKLDVYGEGGPPPITDPPTAASTPFPAVGEVEMGIDAAVNWSAGDDTEWHHVHFGTTSPPPLISIQGGSGFNPGLMDYDTTYYWRVDEVNDAGTTVGSEWHFTTASNPSPALPGPASSPSPTNGAGSVNVEANLTWTAGSNASSHDVYFGTDSSPAFIGNQPGTNFEPGTLGYDTLYYWRVDEVNGVGTTPGVVWSFRTELEPPPPPVTTEVHLEDISGNSTPDSRNRWNATVDVLIHDSAGDPVSGVFMEGDWSNGTNGGATCTTSGSGQCSVSKSNLKGSVSSVRFTVNNLSGTDLEYDAAANTLDNPVTVFKNAPPANEAPTASADSFDTEKNVGFSGNVLNNDDRGQPEATVTTNNVVTAEGINISIGTSGGFSYTPPTDFIGTDSFNYTLANSEGSDSAQATIDVSEAPVGGTLSLIAAKRRDRGTWYVDLTWVDGSGSGTVDITRNGGPVADNTANDGSYTDNMGKKPEPGLHTYMVCEDDTGDCASDTVSF